MDLKNKVKIYLINIYITKLSSNFKYISIEIKWKNFD